MNKNIAVLQYISQSSETHSHLANIEQACINGCNWVQLRAKNIDGASYLAMAKTARDICNQYNARLIINDNPKIAKASNADGVHLGKEDITPFEARKLLGEEAIIGGTANTIADIQNLNQAKVDYIGLGPYRFTTTKRKLSPVLGLDGYTKIVNECKRLGIDIPIIAIGGILIEDVRPLANIPIHGIAVSGLITNGDNKKNIIDRINRSFNKPVFSE